MFDLSAYDSRMGFVSILVALLLEQARPLKQGNAAHGLARAWVRWVGHSFDAGRPQHAVLAWTVGVLLPATVTAAVYWVLVLAAGWPLARSQSFTPGTVPTVASRAPSGRTASAVTAPPWAN